jgi:predicted AAA+ superfamily ATPase
VSYWRTTTGEEVDFVVEHGGPLIGVEVKATRRSRVGDIEHLRTFRDEYGDAVRGCLLLHDGEQTESLGDRLVAAPWWSLS